MATALPPGQRESATFPRFGIPRFARRFPKQLATPELEIRGEVEQELRLENALHGLPRIEQVSDFHCVTTWSRRGLRWGGVRFAEFWHEVFVPRARLGRRLTRPTDRNPHHSFRSGSSRKVFTRATWIVTLVAMASSRSRSGQVSSARIVVAAMVIQSRDKVNTFSRIGMPRPSR